LSENNKLYSFWTEGGAVYECLEDHLNLTFNIFTMIFEKRILKILASRLKRKIDDSFIFMVRLAPLMHDVGKAHDSYQNQKRSGWKEPNFSWHEVLSAQVCWNVMERFRYLSHISPSKEFKDLKRTVAAAIVSHHQAIREVERASPPRWIKLSLWNLNTLRSLIYELLNRASAGLKLNIDRDKIVTSAISDLKENMRKCRGSLDGLRNQIFDNIGCRPPKSYSILTGILVLCDWLSASKTRPPKNRSPMLREAERAFPELSHIA